VRGTTATSDELIGNFGSALEGTSIGDCRLTALFAEKMLQANFGVLQHYRPQSGLRISRTFTRLAAITMLKPWPRLALFFSISTAP
jgi:hypothetical protein